MSKEPRDTSLDAVVYEAIGHASMCWSERPKGEFDCREAEKVAKWLLNAFNTELDRHMLAALKYNIAPQAPKPHEHKFHVSTGEYEMTRWCSRCGETWAARRLDPARGFGGWKRVMEEEPIGECGQPSTETEPPFVQHTFSGSFDEALEAARTGMWMPTQDWLRKNVDHALNVFGCDSVTACNYIAEGGITRPLKITTFPNRVENLSNDRPAEERLDNEGVFRRKDMMGCFRDDITIGTPEEAARVAMSLTEQDLDEIEAWEMSGKYEDDTDEHEVGWLPGD